MKLPNVFAPQTSPVPFAAGETIFAAGQPGDTMYLVQTGEVELRLHGRTLETVGPEGWFGEMALIEGGVRSADAVASTDCTLVPVNERQFLFMVGETPFFALQLLRTLSRRLRLADAAALALVVLLAVGWMAAAPAAAAQTLKVDQSLSNSPYTVTADAPYYQVYVGTTSTGVLNQSAYTLTVSGAVAVGQSFGNPAVSGTYNLSGGTLTALSTDVGYVGTGTFNQTGGTHTLSNDLTLASSGGTGTYNLGGTGTPDTLSVAEAIVVGYDGDGIFNQTAGTATAGNSVILGNLDGTRGAYNFNGGTLNTPSVRTAKGTGTFNFNGGTLQASASNTGFLGGLSATNVRNNGATIDTNGFNVTISQGLTHSAIGTLGSTVTVGLGGSGYTSAPTVTVMNGGGYGATAVATINAQGQVTGVTLTNAGTNYTSAPTFSFNGGGGMGATATDTYTPDNPGDGGLSKIGAGTLTLSGANTYTGTTTVYAGTLAVTGSVVGSVFAVGETAGTTSAASVSGTGSIKTVDIEVGDIGNGTFTQSGSSMVQLSKFLAVGHDNASGSAGVGTYNLQGGTLTTVIT